jgi:hypothetical protein
METDQLPEIKKTDPPPTMYQWIRNFEFSKLFGGLGITGLIIGFMAKDIIKEIRPSSWTNCIVCMSVCLLLGLPVLLGKSPKDPNLRTPALVLACGFLFMALLYLLHAAGIWTIPEGYEVITDVIGTFFFIGAWLSLSLKEPDRENRHAEQVALVILCLFILAAGIVKFYFDLETRGIRRASLSTELQLDVSIARLIVNLCNGAVLLSLYAQMRRLFRPPDPVIHLFILLFGCAQIAAHGRDCLGENPQCFNLVVPLLGASVIAWVLLLGKIAFGLYVSYLYFNAQMPAAQNVTMPEIDADPKSAVEDT